MHPAGLFCTIFARICKKLLTTLLSAGIITHVVRDDTGYGGLAQLGERLHGMQEVSGSIPLFSTKKTLHSLCGVFLFAPLLVLPDAVDAVK